LAMALRRAEAYPSSSSCSASSSSPWGMLLLLLPPPAPGLDPAFCPEASDFHHQELPPAAPWLSCWELPLAPLCCPSAWLPSVLVCSGLLLCVPSAKLPSTNTTKARNSHQSVPHIAQRYLTCAHALVLANYGRKPLYARLKSVRPDHKALHLQRSNYQL
jgi:hypothetical protein